MAGLKALFQDLSRPATRDFLFISKTKFLTNNCFLLHGYAAHMHPATEQRGKLGAVTVLQHGRSQVNSSCSPATQPSEQGITWVHSKNSNVQRGPKEPCITGWHRASTVNGFVSRCLRDGWPD